MIALAIVAIVLFAGCVYVLWQAPAILSEAVFQVALAASLQRKMKAVEREDWKTGVFRSTWFPALSVVFVVVVLGLLGHGLCPGATKLTDVLVKCFG